MAPGTKRYLRLETEWLREYARSYLPNDATFAFTPEDLRRSGVTLVDLTHFFRSGVVEFADKLDGPGAYWVVAGEDCDGAELRAEVQVISEMLSVRLLGIERYNGGKDAPDDAA